MIPVWSGEIALFCKRVLNAESRQTGNTFEVITVCSLDSLQEGGLAFSKRVFKEEEYGRPLPEHFVLLAPYGLYSKTGMLIAVDDPRLAFAKVVTEFFTQRPAASIHPTAVDPSAKVHALASVGPFCFIGPRCVVGEGSVLHSHVVLANLDHGAFKTGRAIQLLTHPIWWTLELVADRITLIDHFLQSRATLLQQEASANCKPYAARIASDC